MVHEVRLQRPHDRPAQRLQMFVAVLVVVGGRVVARLVPAAVAGEFLAEGAEHVLIDPGRAGSEQAIEDLPELRARCLLG